MHTREAPLSRLLTCLVVSLLALPGVAASPPPPLEHFLATPTYRLPKLAADGQSYSIVVHKGKSEVLTSIDLVTGKAELITGSSEMILVNYWWKNRDLLLLLLEDREGSREFQTYSLKSKRTELRSALQRPYVRLVNPLPDDPDHVLVCTGVNTELDIRKFNLRTGKSTPLPGYPGFMAAWFTNQQGDLLAGLGNFHKRWFMVFPRGDKRDWRRVELDERTRPDFFPLIVHPDQRRLLGFWHDAGDKLQVAAWDPADDRKEVIWGSEEVDADDLEAWGEEWSSRLGILFETDRPQLHYLEAEDRALAREIDGALPDTFNRFVSSSTDKSRIIVYATSDRVAGDFYLYDRSKRRLSRLGAAFPNTQPALLAGSRFISTRTKDGFPLHGRIHLPREATGPVPAVLVVGDPTARSRSGYNPFKQLLATRGYAVIEIDHRGKGGFGRKFQEAGNGAVAAMTDDILEGLDWAIQQGLVDPNRIAVLGEDNGGLVALQLLKRYPARFRAWVNFMTPMDMARLDPDDFTFGRFSATEITSRFGDERARRSYLRSLDPLSVLPDLRLASFHYYRRQPHSNELIHGGAILEKYFGQHGQPEVFIAEARIPKASDYLENREEITREQLGNVYSRLLEFLGKHLHPTPP